MTHAAGQRPASDRARRRASAYFASSNPERLAFAALFCFSALVGLAMQAFPD